jgi:adenosyl cobinamide kinase/adenosyl cobinamide phosphate guanylyltransferase
VTNASVTLVLGGARSGKSERAEALVAGHGAVTYVATGLVDPEDPLWTARIARHRDRRPAAWSTVEVGGGGDLAAAVAGAPGAVLVDSLGTWVAGHDDFAVDLAPVTAALAARRSPTVLVSDEVGLGVHPATELGGRFRDALGDINRGIAEAAGTVLLVVAGRLLELA